MIFGSNSILFRYLCIAICKCSYSARVKLNRVSAKCRMMGYDAEVVVGVLDSLYNRGHACDITR